MNMKIVLNDGAVVSAELPQFSSVDYAKEVNQPRLSAVSFGGMIVAKQSLQMIVPADVTTTPTLEVHLHNGQIIPLDAADYNSSETLQRFNDNTVMMLSLGTAVINKNVIKLIVPVQV